MISFKWKVPKTPIFNSAIGAEYLKKNNVRIFSAIMPILQTGIIMETPVGASGTLRKNNLIGWGAKQSKIYNYLEYAAATNDGRRASPVAASADAGLDKWIRLTKKGQSFFNALKRKYKNITVEKAIFLLKRGKKMKRTPGQHFYEKGIAKSQKAVDRQYEIILKNMAKEMVSA